MQNNNNSLAFLTKFRIKKILLSWIRNIIVGWCPQAYWRAGGTFLLSRSQLSKSWFKTQASGTGALAFRRAWKGLSVCLVHVAFYEWDSRRTFYCSALFLFVVHSHLLRDPLNVWPPCKFLLITANACDLPEHLVILETPELHHCDQKWQQMALSATEDKRPITQRQQIHHADTFPGELVCSWPHDLFKQEGSCFSVSHSWALDFILPWIVL